MFYEPWILAAIDQAGYNGIHNSHIYAVAKELLQANLDEIDQGTFEAACRHCGVDPKNFTQKDLNNLEEIMNRI